jgi:hypothetical protein
MKRAIIYFNNGAVDWIDPIDDEVKDIFYGDTLVIITNEANVKYPYNKVDIKKIEIVEVEDK